jgi:hypothetical protein
MADDTQVPAYFVKEALEGLERVEKELRSGLQGGCIANVYLREKLAPLTLLMEMIDNRGGVVKAEGK